MPNYRLRPSDLYAPPPYRAQAATFWSFAIDADRDRLDHVVDDELNVLGHDYHVLAPLVLVTYVEIKRSSSLSAPPARQGWFPENDLMLWLLVGRWDEAPIGWYVPLVWVNHPIAVIEGREAFGYPKALADVTIPADGAGPFETSTHLFPGVADACVTHECVNRVRRDGAPAQEITADVVDSGDVLAQRFAEDLAGTGVRLLSRILPRDILLLREVPAGTDPTGSVVQQIMRSRVDDLDFVSGSILRDRWIVDFPDTGGRAVADHLGVAGRQVARFAYRVTMNCTLGTPIVVP